MEKGDQAQSLPTGTKLSAQAFFEFEIFSTLCKHNTTCICGHTLHVTAEWDGYGIIPIGVPFCGVLRMVASHLSAGRIEYDRLLRASDATHLFFGHVSEMVSHWLLRLLWMRLSCQMQKAFKSGQLFCFCAVGSIWDFLFHLWFALEVVGGFREGSQDHENMIWLRIWWCVNKHTHRR